MHGSWLIYIAALLPLCGLLLLLAQQRKTPPAEAEPVPVEAGAAAHSRPLSQWLGKLPIYRGHGETWRSARQHSHRVAVLSVVLQRAGIFNPRDQLALVSTTAATALALGIGAGVLLALHGYPAARAGAGALGAAVALALLALALLYRFSARRQDLIEHEAITLIQSTRMLWRAGLSLPRTLAALCDELRSLAPESTRELRSILQRIESGQNQEDALSEALKLTTSEGFREYLVIIRQVAQSGGGIDQALADLYQVMRNRQRSELQEKVSKLSAKMSVVMMLFLFPALLIVLGGPGFIALSGAITQLGSR